MSKKDISIYNLSTEEPNLLLEWDYNKNTKPPNLYFRSSKDRIWWKCQKQHSWLAAISSRAIYRQGCPYCANKLACKENCLITKHEDLCKEWNFDKNNLSPTDVLPGSKKKVWWKCKTCLFEWRAQISDRVRGTKCTRCNYGFTLRDRDKIYNDDRTKKICKICNIMLPLDNFRLKGNRTKGYYENYICRSCDSAKVKDYRLTDKGIAAEIVRRTKHASKKNNLPFDLDVQWVLNRLNSIEWKCELTKIPMRKNRDIISQKNEGFMWDSISIDKVIPSNGYVKSNVRFVLNIINLFKHKGTDDRMYMLAEELLKHRK